MIKKIAQYIVIAVLLSSLPTVYAHSYEVKGVITDSNGDSVKGIIVTVTCNGISKEAETSGGGLFSVNFSLEQCPMDATVNVVAQNGDFISYGDTRVNGENLRVDVELNELSEVPEFTASTALIALLGGSAAYYYFSRRSLDLTNR